MHRFAKCLTLAACGLFATSAALAADFTPESADAFVTRANDLIETARMEDNTAANSPERFGAACQGLTADTMTYSGRWPAWSTRGLSSFCSAVNLMAHGKPCKAFQEAAIQFAKADSERDPADVVRAAEDLVIISHMFVEAAHNARRC